MIVFGFDGLDPDVLDVIEVITTDTVTDLLGSEMLAPETFTPEGGFGLGAVFDVNPPFDGQFLPPGGDQIIARARVRPVGDPIRADRDFVLHWRPESGSRPEARVLIEDRHDARYGMVLVMPPAPTGTIGEGLPTETLFVVDVSGSMPCASAFPATSSPS